MGEIITTITLTKVVTTVEEGEALILLVKQKLAQYPNIVVYYVIVEDSVIVNARYFNENASHTVVCHPIPRDNVANWRICI